MNNSYYVTSHAEEGREYLRSVRSENKMILKLDAYLFGIRCKINAYLTEQYSAKCVYHVICLFACTRM